MADSFGAKRIEVVGVRDLQKALRQIDRDLPRELAAGLAEAAEIVAVHARRKVPVRSGAARGSIKPRKEQRGASLAVGGNKAPYFPWLDWGGRVGRGRSQVRPFIPEGRYVYPSLREKRPAVEEKVDEVLARLATRAGFETTGRSDR